MNTRARRRMDYLRGFRDGYEGYPSPLIGSNEAAERGWDHGLQALNADVAAARITDPGMSTVPRVTEVQVLRTGTLELVHHGEDGIPPNRFGSSFI